MFIIKMLVWILVDIYKITKLWLEYKIIVNINSVALHQIMAVNYISVLTFYLGTQFDKSLVKVMVGQNHGVCKNTTVERSLTFWRNESGSVISWENLLRTNSSDGKTFLCEVPTYGDEPEYFYRKRFTPSSLSINIGESIHNNSSNIFSICSQ